MHLEVIDFVITRGMKEIDFLGLVCLILIHNMLVGMIDVVVHVDVVEI